MQAAADTIRDANVRYHDLAAEHYDSKWGIGYDEVGQAQVTRQAAQGARRRCPAAASAARSRSAPGPATSPSTCCAPGVVALGGRHRHLARACSSVLSASAERARARAWRPRRLRGVGAAVRGRLLRPRLRPRRAAPPPRPRRAPSASSGACCAPAAWWRSAASRRTTATASPSVPKRGALRGGAAVARALAGAARAAATAQRQRPARRTSSSRSWTCTRSRPAELSRHAERGGLRATCA